MSNQDWQHRIEGKLDTVAEHIASINTTLAKQEVSLAEHIRRTHLLEKSVQLLEKHMYMIIGGIMLLAAIIKLL